MSELPDEQEVFRLVTEAAAECLEVERVGIWLHHPDRQSIECVCLYTLSEDRHSTGIRLHAETHPAYFSALEKERAIVADDAWTHHATSSFAESYLISVGITSMLDAPIYHDGLVIGVICCEHIGKPRHWDEFEQHFAGSLAACTAWLLEQFKHDRAEAELKRHRDAMERASRLEAMGRMAAGCAHDFNNILVSIMGYAHLLELELSGNPLLHQHLKRLQENALSGRSITQQLLSFARLEPTIPQPQCMRKLMEQIASQIDAVAGSHLRFTWSAETDLPTVLGVPQQLSQVAINLACNARDAAPVGGNLRVHLAAATVTAGEVANLSEGRYLLWRFLDDGPGLPPVVLKHLFEPFVTTKPPGIGTGLGLATSYGIISRFGGKMDAFNRPEGGAEFRIYLPAISEKEKPAPQEAGLFQTL
ncbi:MAG TPA: ATP-binding protein [Verrucomicrobiae bacterium]